MVGEDGLGWAGIIVPEVLRTGQRRRQGDLATVNNPLTGQCISF